MSIPSFKPPVPGVYREPSSGRDLVVTAVTASPDGSGLWVTYHYADDPAHSFGVPGSSFDPTRFVPVG